MKKQLFLSLLLSIVLLSIVSMSLIAMEAPTEESEAPEAQEVALRYRPLSISLEEELMPPQAPQLSKKEAEELYMDLVQKVIQHQPVSDEYYKGIMKAVIPVLGYSQIHIHNPLIWAIGSEDVEFVQFLLKHGADPSFHGMGLNAYNFLSSQGRFSPEYRAKIKALLDKYNK